MLRYLKRERLFRYSAVVLLLSLFSYSCQRDEVTRSPEDDLPPAVPTSLAVFGARDGKIGIEWDYPDNYSISRFNIYRSINGEGNFMLAGFTSDSYFVDDSLSYDTVYYYRVSAVSRIGKESSRSGAVSAKPVNTYPPLTPAYAEINARNWNDSLYIRLRWEPATDGDLAGYKIYRSETGNFEADSSSLLAFSASNIYDDSRSLELYKTYFYKIRAVDKGNLESNSSQVLSDRIMGLSEAVFPSDGATVKSVENFVFKALPSPARYEVILQSNQYFGEIWRAEISTTQLNGNISISTGMLRLEYYTDYFWRIVTYTPGSGGSPNSISRLYRFMIKP